jgi:hypothetical protein
MTSTSAAIARAVGRGVVLAALLLWAMACSKVGGGRWLTARWIGSDTGRISAPATASWCPLAGRLEVKAVSGDLGFGLVLYPVGDLAAGSYPAFDPGIDSVHRPGASAALRWYTQQLVVGFQSDSGSVQLTGKDLLDLRFGFRLRSLDGKDTLVTQGRAANLQRGTCPADSVPNAAPTQ